MQAPFSNSLDGRFPSKFVKVFWFFFQKRTACLLSFYRCGVEVVG
jgi:hypothetical protein